MHVHSIADKILITCAVSCTTMKSFLCGGNWPYMVLGIIGAALILIYNLRHNEAKTDSCPLLNLNCAAVFYAALFSQPPSKEPRKLNEPNRGSYSQFNQDLIMNEVSVLEVLQNLRLKSWRGFNLRWGGGGLLFGFWIIPWTLKNSFKSSVNNSSLLRFSANERDHEAAEQNSAKRKQCCTVTPRAKSRLATLERMLQPKMLRCPLKRMLSLRLRHRIRLRFRLRAYALSLPPTACGKVC